MKTQTISVWNSSEIAIPITVDGKEIWVPGVTALHGAGRWLGEISEAGYELLWEEIRQRGHKKVLTIILSGYKDCTPEELRRWGVWEGS